MKSYVVNFHVHADEFWPKGINSEQWFSQEERKMIRPIRIQS